MISSELHAQAGIWHNHGSRRSAALVMEGEAADRSNGGGVAVDALYRATLARGLRLATDLDHLDPRPVPGWRVRIDEDRSLTLEWPHFWPLLEHAPLDLPEGWLDTAAAEGLVMVFVGYGLGMHTHEGHPLNRLDHAAETGALAGGPVPVLT